eukprot:11889666-Prorocentrum_lima.AAC.1
MAKEQATGDVARARPPPSHRRPKQRGAAKVAGILVDSQTLPAPSLSPLKDSLVALRGACQVGHR